MTEIDEDHPIWQAIDRGGGQVCDISGIIVELDRAGYTIVPKENKLTLRGGCGINHASIKDWQECPICEAIIRSRLAMGTGSSAK